MKKFLLALLIVFATATFAAADTIYLRDGRQVRGTLLGFINGQFVMRVETQLSTSPSTTNTRRRDDIQYFRPEEVERVEIDGRPMEDTRYVTRNVQVTLDSNWIDSGVFVRSGQRVQVSATGVITVGRTRITPDGLQRTDPSAPLPNANEGKLIGAIGNDASSPIIELGSRREFTADRNGRLFLTANRGSFADARGAFDVQIQRERGVSFREADDLDRSGGIRSRNRFPGGPGRGPGRVERDLSVPGNSRGVDAGIDVRGGRSNHVHGQRYYCRRSTCRHGWTRGWSQHGLRLDHWHAAGSECRRRRTHRLHSHARRTKQPAILHRQLADVDSGGRWSFVFAG